MGMDCRYSMLGFKANSMAAVTPAVVEWNVRRTAPNRNPVAAMKHMPEEIAPARPVRQSESNCTKGSISR